MGKITWVREEFLSQANISDILIWYARKQIQTLTNRRSTCFVSTGKVINTNSISFTVVPIVLTFACQAVLHIEVDGREYWGHSFLLKLLSYKLWNCQNMGMGLFPLKLSKYGYGSFPSEIVKIWLWVFSLWNCQNMGMGLFPLKLSKYGYGSFPSEIVKIWVWVFSLWNFQNMVMGLFPLKFSKYGSFQSNIT